MLDSSPPSSRIARILDCSIMRARTQDVLAHAQSMSGLSLLKRNDRRPRMADHGDGA